MAKRTMYSAKLGKKVASGARPKEINEIHVISSQSNKWSVVPEGSVRSIRSSLSKSQAISFAKKTARQKSKGEVVIHDRNGQVDTRISLAS